jgi:hypothetical protein
VTTFGVKMLFAAQIEYEYEKIEENTLAAWKSEPGIGGHQPLPYDEKLLAFTAGQWFQPTDTLLRLHEELLALGFGDHNLKVIARKNMHFTLLALSPHRYRGPNEYPDELELLKRLYTQHVAQVQFELSSLRLVPLPNTLLLAGIPNEGAFTARRGFASELLASEWGTLLRARYEPYPIPPVIWHTTLVRSSRQLLPRDLREVFSHYRDRRFQDIDLGQPILAAVSYDWSTVRQILP